MAKKSKSKRTQDKREQKRSARGRRSRKRTKSLPAKPITSPSLKYASRFETSETIFGRQLPAQELRDFVSQFSWKHTFAQLAYLAAVIFNRVTTEEQIRRATIDPLIEVAEHAARTNSAWKNGLIFLRKNRDNLRLAHEEGIIFLQALAIADGSEGDRIPTRGEIAFMLAAGNGLLPVATATSASNGDGHSALEDLGGYMTRALRFNHSPDLLRMTVRTRFLFSAKPTQGPLADPDDWRRLQECAFDGRLFNDFFEAYLGPLCLMTNLWGDDRSAFPTPLISVDFLKNSSIAADDFFSAIKFMTVSRSEVSANLRMNSEQLPTNLATLVYRPLLEVEPQKLVASTPASVFGQMHAGLWSRYLDSAKHLYDDSRGAKIWLPAFGNMVEEWCRKVAMEARRQSPSLQVVLPSHPGARDEIEDVIVIEPSGVILFSVKGRLMRAEAARGFASTTITADWFDDFLFAPRSNKHRGGAITLIDKVVTSIREGKFVAAGIENNVPIFPVVVSYDTLGENDLLYEVLYKKCSDRGLLKQSDVAPFCIGSVDEFEQMMSCAAHGKQISDLLRSRRGIHRFRRLDQILYESLDDEIRRLDFFQSEFLNLKDRILVRHFRTSQPALNV